MNRSRRNRALSRLVVTFVSTGKAEMNIFADRHLVRKSGIIVYPQEVLQNKVVALYFSAGWCPPCKEFTPILGEFYNELHENELPFEVVFVSSDKTATDMETYFKQSHGDWLLFLSAVK